MATVEAWVAYAAARGGAIPASGAAAAALVRASDYIRTAYLYKSVSGYPAEVVDEATYIAAALELEEPGFFNRVHIPGETNKMMTRAGEISWTPTRNPRFGDSIRPTVPAIEALFSPYQRSGVAAYVV